MRKIIYRFGRYLLYSLLDLWISIKLLLRQKGALPDFLIIGGMKCGTTSLFHYLGQHPQLQQAIYKELHFFTKKFHKGLDWYKLNFKAIESNKNILYFEADPDYLYNPKAVERIVKSLPNIKIIVLLRNPVDRTISEYFHRKRSGITTASLEDSLKKGQYINKSLYYKHLLRYYDLIPIDRILVIGSEQFYEDPSKILKEIFVFLKVEENYQINDLRPRQVGRNKTLVSKKTKNNLVSFFYPHNQDLFRLLNKRFDWE